MLGIRKGYRHILTAVENFTDKEVLYIESGEACAGEFFLPIEKMRTLQLEIDKIDRRAKVAENEVKLTTAHNELTMMLGKDIRPFRLGRNEIRNLIQKYAEKYADDPNFTEPAIQEELVLKVAEAAGTFAERNPEATDSLVSDLQLTRLEVAIRGFETLMSRTTMRTSGRSF